MDNLMVFSALNILRTGFRDVPPFLDEDLRVLYAQRLAELPPAPHLQTRIVSGLAMQLERLAARLRHTVDDPPSCPRHA